MNTQTQEALKMVLEFCDNFLSYEGFSSSDVIDIQKACKEALEQPVRFEGFTTIEMGELKKPAQEPVAWIDTKADIDEAFITNELKKAHIKRNSYCDNWNIPLYTHPAPSWQGLSDTEIAFMAVPFYDVDNLIANEFGFARAIEQALRNKNGNT